MMESSKSDGNNERKPQDTKIVVDNQTVIGIVEPTVEKEIQNVLITSEFDQDQPSCSWKNTGTISSQTTETKQPTLVLAKDNSTSYISIDVKGLSQENISRVQQDNPQSNEPTSHKASPQNIEISLSKLSLTNLFDNIEVTSLFDNIEEVREPRAIPEIPVTNQPQSQSPSPFFRNPVVPSTTNRGIHVLNIPNDSINRSLQRQDAVVHIPNNSNNCVLGPPPSYSKSLLDRRINTCTSIQFVAPIPPPSYDGMESELRYTHTLGHGHTGGFTLGLGNTWQGQPQPAYCPVCETVTITQVDIRVSRIAHILAMVMFLLLCWPFCLLPYFLNICNYTFHHCSVCHSYLGARRPFQRG